jgi:hypothetical protein
MDDDANYLIKGYQPVAHVQDGYQPITEGYQPKNVTKVVQQGTPTTPPQASETKVIPPKGGTGVVTLKK